MRFSRLSLVALIFITMPFGQAMAQAQNEYCQAPSPTKINVIPSTTEVKYDYSLDLAGLQRIQSDSINPFGFHQTSQTRGLMRGSIQIEGPNITFGREQIGPRGGYACAWFDKIDIKIFIEPEIVIAKEVAADPCTHKVTREHELEHVMIDRRIVNKYARSMGVKVNEALKKRGYVGGPVKLDELEDLQNSMARIVQQVLQLEQQKMHIERTERQQALDSLEEYERISQACPGFRSRGP